MSIAQENRAQRLVEEFTSELQVLRNEISSLKMQASTLEAQISSKEKEAKQIESQIYSIKMSDSY